MTKKRIGLALATALGMFPVAAALAEEGFYFGLGGGASMWDLPSKSEFDAILGGIPATTSLEDVGEAWGLQVGYRWVPWFAAEVGYIDLGKGLYEADLTSTTLRYSVRYLSAGPTVSALGMLPLGERFDLHARAGVYFGDTRVRERIEDRMTGDFMSFEGQASEKDLFGGVGIAWNINEAYSLRAEYQHFIDVGDEDHTGEQDIDFLSFIVLFR
ncbi:MAG TPA: outer membrane beta-barrel protein [Steroidobacter sp.]|nr:outer membrane beta-barrel protein [Steroidobacter sp.]